MLIKDSKKIDVPKAFMNGFTKPVTFELHVSQTPTSHITGKRSFPASRGIEPFYQMEDGEKVVIFRYAETQRVSHKGGLSEYIYLPNEIEFLRRGNIVCDPAILLHRELYYWMHNHPQCFGGPNYDPKKGPIFFQLDPEKEAKTRVDAEIKEYEAKELILKKWSLDRLRMIALEFGDMQAMEKDETMLRDYLLMIMKRDPISFHKRATADRMERKAELTEALIFGIIQFNDSTKVWSWGVDEIPENKQICVCINQEDEKERLLRYFDNAIREDNIDYFNERLRQERKKKEPKLQPVTS